MYYAFTLAGQPLLALPSRALWAPALRLLAVSDLHLGKAERIARREGRMVPPYETEETLARLGDLVSAFRPVTVICLGDSFDDDRAAEALSPAHKATLAGLMAGRGWVWIAGNHDPAPPDLGGAQKAEHREGAPGCEIVFRHVAAPVLAEAAEVSGHYHPKARIAGRALPAFLVDARRAILPAFGLYTGGLDVTDAAFDALAGPEAQALAISRRIVAAPRAGLLAAARRRPWR